MSNGQIQIPFPYTTLPPTHIKALAQRIRAKLNVTTHKKKFTTYENCFVGNKLVTWLVESKAIPTRRDAIQICHRLFEARLIVHVKNNELFGDDKELYHLIDPVAGTDLTPNNVDVQTARSYIQHKKLPKHDSTYKQLTKVLLSKGLQLPEISRAICLEKYKVKDTDNFPKTQINKTKPRANMGTIAPAHIEEKNEQQNLPFLTTNELLKVQKKIIGILKYAFLAADQSRSNDLDLPEFEYLLDRLGIKVSHKGAELLFRAILSHHNKRFLGFYEFKMAFMVDDPVQFIQTQNDLNPARVLRRHIRKYYETVAEAHKANRKKLAEIAWGLFNHDRTKHATMNLSEFKEGIKYLGLHKLSQAELDFLFRSINKSKTGMMKKEEFTHCVKKDIPVSIGKVVNVKEILFDTFERILTAYQGTKTEFPVRHRNTSIVQRNPNKTIPLKLPKPPPRMGHGHAPRTDVLNVIAEAPRKKKSIFQRMRYKSIFQRKKTIKAPVKSPFGSNLAEMADTGNSMMNDIILSMVTEDDGTVDRKDDDIITADEFRQLFSHSFYPQSVQELAQNKKAVDRNQLSMISMLGHHASVATKTSNSMTAAVHTGTVSEKTDVAKPGPDALYESDYSEIFPDIFPADHDHMTNLQMQSPTLSPEVVDKFVQGKVRKVKKSKSNAAVAAEMYVFEEEEKQAVRKRTDGDSLLDFNSEHFDQALKHKASLELMSMDENASYTPPPPTLLSVDVGAAPPWTELDEVDYDQFTNTEADQDAFDTDLDDEHGVDSGAPSRSKKENQQSVVIKSVSQVLNSNIKSEIEAELDEDDNKTQDESEALDLQSQPTLRSQPAVENESETPKSKIMTLILLDDILNEDSDDDKDEVVATEVDPDPDADPELDSNKLEAPDNKKQSSLTPMDTDELLRKESQQSSAASQLTRVSHVTPGGHGYKNNLVLEKMQNYRQLHTESKELHENEEYGLSYYDGSGTFNYKKDRDGEFAQFIHDGDGLGLEQMDEAGNSSDSLRQLQMQYGREQLLKDDLQTALFDESNIDDHDEPHPKDTAMDPKQDYAVQQPQPAQPATVESKSDHDCGGYDTPDLGESVCDVIQFEPELPDTIHTFTDHKTISNVNVIDIIDTEKSLKPSVAKRISRGNSPAEKDANTERKYDLFDSAADSNHNHDNGTKSKNKSKKRKSKQKHKAKSKSNIDDLRKAQKPPDFDRVNRPRSIPYTTPAQLAAIHAMVHAERLAHDVSELVGGSDGDGDEDDMDPGAPGTANVYPDGDGAQHQESIQSVSDIVSDIVLDVERDMEHNADNEEDGTRKLSVEDIINSELNMPDFAGPAPPQQAAEEEKSADFAQFAPPCVVAPPCPTKPLPSMAKLRKKRKTDKFEQLPPIPGVLTVKKVKCKNLVRGKMTASETYYVRVYQGECDKIERSRAQKQTRKGKGSPAPMSPAAKLRELKSKKFRFALPARKKLGSLPTLIVIKSYPVFCSQSESQKEKEIIWQNLPASVTKDAKSLRVGVYMKRSGELVLIGSTALATSKKHLIPKPRIGIKTTTITAVLSVPDKFAAYLNKSEMEITYSFCPRQFNVYVGVLQSTKLAIYPSKIPVCIQLIRFHLLKISHDYDNENDNDDEYEYDSEEEEEVIIVEHENEKKNKFYNKAHPSKQLINNLVGDMNCGHYKFDKTESEVVWHGLLRWYREIKPFPVLNENNISSQFVTRHNELSDDEFTMQFVAALAEPYMSLFLWSIDFLIEMSSWYSLKLNHDNCIISSFVPNLFGCHYTQKEELKEISDNAFSFVLRLIQLRKKQQFKLS